jgi:simple sugar transport system substrate-binding protein
MTLFRKFLSLRTSLALALAFALVFVAVALLAPVGFGASTAKRASTAQPLKIIYVANGPSSDPFQAVVAHGLTQAGKDFHVTTVFSGPTSQQFSPNDELRILQAAIAQKPDGLIVSDVAPQSLNATIKQAADSGIRVVLANTGLGEATATGALTYVGNDEPGSGRLGGQLMNQYSKHVLLVTGPDSVPLIKQRNDGFDSGFKGKITRLTIPLSDFTDVTKMRNEIEIALNKDKTIDGMFSIGLILSPPMLAARDELGSRGSALKLGSIDLGKPVIAALKAGTYEFGLDQQQFLQGYLPAMFIVQNIRYAFTPVTPFVKTGPAVVTSKNVNQIAALTAQGLR